MWFFLVISGLSADLLRNKNVLSTTNVRKIMNALGQFVLKLDCVRKYFQRPAAFTARCTFVQSAVL